MRVYRQGVLLEQSLSQVVVNDDGTGQVDGFVFEDGDVIYHDYAPAHVQTAIAADVTREGRTDSYTISFWTKIDEGGLEEGAALRDGLLKIISNDDARFYDAWPS